MSRQSDEEILMRNYLLGGLDEEVQEQVEERLLCDDDFAEKLLEAQDHLIDDYVFDALPESERKSFEKNFHFTDERRRKMLFAQTMETYVDDRYIPRTSSTGDPHPPPPSRRTPWLFVQSHKAVFAIGMSFVILLFFMVPKLLNWMKPVDPIALLQSQRADIERQVREINKHPADQRIQSLPAYELSLQPTLLREEGGIKRAPLTGEIHILTLKLALPQVRHENYNALVSTVEGEELFAVEGLTSEVDAGIATVPVKIPTEFLPTGDYQIQLRGKAAAGKLEDVARYNFRVIKK